MVGILRTRGFVSPLLWSGIIKSPLESLVNQDFFQTFARLFSKKKNERKNPEVEVKYNTEILKKRLYPFHEIIGVTLNLLNTIARTENSQKKF